MNERSAVHSVLTKQETALDIHTRVRVSQHTWQTCAIRQLASAITRA